MLDLACVAGGILVFLGLVPGKKIFFYLQSTPDNLNLQGKLKKVRVIESLKQITGSKEISKWMGRECN